MRQLPHQYTLFLCLLALASSGCIGVPNLSQNHGRTLARQVGPADSNKAFRIGRTSRYEVVKLLGEPHCRTQHQTALGYRHSVITGYWFPCSFGPCGPGPGGARRTTEWFYLEFDLEGVLKRASADDYWAVFIASTQDSDDAEFNNPRKYSKPIEW